MKLLQLMILKKKKMSVRISTSLRVNKLVCLTFSNKYNEDIETLHDEEICRYLFIDILKFQLFFAIRYGKT
ncbi:MAG: hypothetical protein WBL44_00255 [Nitrososphaeraceae archaeon]